MVLENSGFNKLSRRPEKEMSIKKILIALLLISLIIPGLLFADAVMEWGKKAVQKYIKKTHQNLSYTPMEWGPIYNYGGKYHINHKYKIGGKIKDEVFIINAGGMVVEVQLKSEYQKPKANEEVSKTIIKNSPIPKSEPKAPKTLEFKVDRDYLRDVYSKSNGKYLSAAIANTILKELGYPTTVKEPGKNVEKFWFANKRVVGGGKIGAGRLYRQTFRWDNYSLGPLTINCGTGIVTIGKTSLDELKMNW